MINALFIAFIAATESAADARIISMQLERVSPMKELSFLTNRGAFKRILLEDGSDQTWEKENPYSQVLKEFWLNTFFRTLFLFGSRQQPI